MKKMKWLTSVKRIALLSLALLLAVLIFVWGATQQSILVNTNMYEIDQSAYMDYAKNLARTKLTFVGGRNRMPLYPALMSFFYEEGMSDDAFFERGKKVGIGIGLIGLLVIFLIYNCVSNTLQALTGTLVAMFTVFIYKSPYFQSEVFFYTLSLILFYLSVSLIHTPKIKTAVLAGVVGGLGHLTKASVFPSILLAALLIIIRIIYDRWQGGHRGETLVGERQHVHTALYRLLCVVIFLVSFLLVIFIM